MMRRTLAFALGAGIAFAAAAQPYPNRPVRIVVPYLPGGGVDFVARAIAPRLGEGLGASVVVENRPGGGTNIGSELVARAAPDGYTLLMVGGANTTAMSLYRKPGYDIQRDFAPIVLLTYAPNILVVHPSVPATSVKGLIALARARAGELTYASAGNASSNHLSGELFKRMAGIDLVHVPYKGGGGAVVDLIAGHVAMYFGTTPSTLPQVRGGRLRALAVTGARRSQAVPELPTIAEAALPGYEIVAWHGLAAPAGTSQEIVARINAEAMRVLALAEVKERMAAQGVEIVGGTPRALAEFIATDVARYAKLIREAGIRAE